MTLRPILALPLFALSATAALAQEDLTCRNGLFPAEPPFALAKVRGEERAFFHQDMDGCPWSGTACRDNSYVVPGDTVIVGKVRKGFACAFYPSKGGGTAGWVPTRQLSLQFVETMPAPADWVGTWSSEGNPLIKIEKRLGSLHATGEAFWPGRPGTHDYPSIHVGEIDGAVAVTGHKGRYEDDNLCEIDFTLLGPYLLASSNRNCGGANVMFTGVFQRER
jgi:hypothetical protein